MVYLFCVLFGIASVFAQPVEGPYVVAVTYEGYRFQDVHLVVRGDTADCFFLLDDPAAEEKTVRHATFSLASHELIDAPEIVCSIDGWQWDIEDVLAEAGYWYMVAVGCEHYADHMECYELNKAILAQGQNALLARDTLYSGYASPTGGGACLGSNDLAKRFGGGLVVGSILFGSVQVGNWFEPHNTVRVKFLPQGSLSPDTSFEMCDDGCNVLHGPWMSRIFSLQQDSAAILYDGGSAGSGLITKAPPLEEYPPPIELACGHNLGDFPEVLRTPGGRFLVVLATDNSHSIDEIGVNGDCLEIGNFNGLPRVHAVAGHESYGFAALQTHHARLMLARADTSGNEVQPVGVLYEVEGENSIVEANLTVTDDGRIVALWSENMWVEVEEMYLKVLKIAFVDWDTFLDADDDSRAAPMPLSLSLSSYPNPFNSTVSLKYDLPEAGEVSLAIYNLAGQEVTRIVQERQTAGQYSVDWSASGASGIYFAKLSAGHTDCISKLVYLR